MNKLFPLLINQWQNNDSESELLCSSHTQKEISSPPPKHSRKAAFRGCLASEPTQAVLQSALPQTSSWRTPSSAPSSPALAMWHCKKKEPFPGNQGLKQLGLSFGSKSWHATEMAESWCAVFLEWHTVISKSLPPLPSTLVTLFKCSQCLLHLLRPLE